ncbi:MAG: hypothetical protein HeimAB125_12290 [Candidatus Heimdallarchaeota archaeon AB_125]|nr:MAG: hypothetical protein HeimAB125_12290 [Candidatus Heimdallarchaeota archaeon AB_125]
MSERIDEVEIIPPQSKPKPDRQFDLVVIKMMAALTISVALLFGGGTIFVYAAAGNIAVDPYDSTVGTILGIHLALLMFYYSVALFKYIVSD